MRKNNVQAKWEFRLLAHIVPVPKGRPRAGLGGRMYTPAKTKQFEQDFGFMARAKARKDGVRIPYAGSLRLSVMIHAAQVPADIDNYVKAIMDALNGVIYADDRQVIGLNATLLRNAKQPHIELRLEPVEEEQEPEGPSFEDRVMAPPKRR